MAERTVNYREILDELFARNSSLKIGCTPSSNHDCPTPTTAHAPTGDNWPPESLDAERRFTPHPTTADGLPDFTRLPEPQPCAKLVPFIGRKVRTPAGPGTLLQVFTERVTVLLDSERDKCSFFTPAQIEPVSVD